MFPEVKIGDNTYHIANKTFGIVTDTDGVWAELDGWRHVYFKNLIKVKHENKEQETMAMNMKEVASLRGNDKLYAENAAKIDWSGVGGKAKEILEEDEKEVIKDFIASIPAPTKEDALLRYMREHGSGITDSSRPIIQVSAFKARGKWYASKFSYLKTSHLASIENDASFNFIELMEMNHESVIDYSPLSSKFQDRDMHFVIDVYNCNGFCKYIIPSRKVN